MARLSLVLSVIALTVALLGATPLGEAAKMLVIPRGAVDTQHLRNGAVTAAKVKDRSLVERDFRKGQLPRGPVGPAGPPGSIDGVSASGDLTGNLPGADARGGRRSRRARSRTARCDSRTRPRSAARRRVDLAPLGPHSCVAASAAAPGAKPYDRTLVLPTQNLPPGAFVTQVFNTGTPNRVLFRVCNATAKTIDPPLGAWAYLAWRP